MYRTLAKVNEQGITFAEFIQRERKRHDLSQREFAQKLGISHVTVSRYEKGTSADPELPVLRKLAVMSGVPLPLMIAIAYPDMAGEIDAIPPRVQLLALRLAKYPEVVIEHLIAIAEAK